MLDIQLTGGRRETSRILQAEVAGQQRTGRFQPCAPFVVVREQLSQFRFAAEQVTPGRLHQSLGEGDGALRRRMIEQAFQNGMDDRPANRGRTRRLGQPVDHPKAVTQRTVHEVARPRRRQRPDDADAARGMRGVPTGCGDFDHGWVHAFGP